MNAPPPREGSDDFRSLDAERGVMTSMDGRRAVLLSSSFLFGLTRTLDAESPAISCARAASPPSSTPSFT